jgi:hypothetical protein
MPQRRSRIPINNRIDCSGHPLLKSDGLTYHSSTGQFKTGHQGRTKTTSASFGLADQRSRQQNSPTAPIDEGGPPQFMFQIPINVIGLRL